MLEKIISNVKQVLGESSTNEAHVIESELCDPELGSFALSCMPSIASFFENYDGPGDKDDGKGELCTVSDDTGAVCSIDDSSGDSVAAFQFDVEIGENTGNS